MARRPGSIAFRKGAGSIGFLVGLEHPDFARARIKPAKLERAYSAMEEYLRTIVVPQVPIRTGQLRASYRYDRRAKVFGPSNTTRWDPPSRASGLTNLSLAFILRTRGYLDVEIGPGHRRFVTTIVRRELSGKTFDYSGRVVLSSAHGALS